MNEKPSYFQVYPPETAQHITHQIREQLKFDSNVHIAGEFETRKHPGIPTTKFIIAPSQSISILDVDVLNRFMNVLVAKFRLPVEVRDNFQSHLEHKVYDNRDICRDVPGVSGGRVSFKEITGIVFEDHTTRVVAYQPEVLKSDWSNLEETTRTEMFKHYKHTDISIYSEPEMADLVYQYFEGMESEKLRYLYDGTTSIFEELKKGVVTLDDIDMLHRGELGEYLRHIQEAS